MSREQTEETMRRYLDALVSKGDFASHFADDVVWTTMESREEVRGRDAVRDLIVSLHTQMFEAVPELVSCRSSSMGVVAARMAHAESGADPRSQ